MPESSNEFFTLDAAGQKADARLHEPILNSPEGLAAAEASRLRSIARLRGDGIEPSVIEEMFGPISE